MTDDSTRCLGERGKERFGEGLCSSESAALARRNASWSTHASVAEPQTALLEAYIAALMAQNDMVQQLDIQQFRRLA